MRLLKSRGRPSILTFALVATLAGAVVLSAVRPPARADDPAGGVSWDAGEVSWDAGDVSWGFVRDGRCITTQDVTITTRSNHEAKRLASVLASLPPKNDFPAGSGIQDAHINVSDPGDSSTVAGILHAYLPHGRCQAANTAQAALFGATGGGRLDTIQLAAAPTWLKGAIAAVVGACVYVAVGTLVTAGITATGVLAGASAAAVTATTALSGCVGGALSTSVTLAIAGAGNGWKSTLTNAAAGCLSGATFALLPIKQIGEVVGNALRGAFGSVPKAIVGEAGVAAAQSAGVELGGITEVVNHASDVLVAVR